MSQVVCRNGHEAGRTEAVKAGAGSAHSRLKRCSPVFLLLLGLAAPTAAQSPKAETSEFDCLIQPRMVLKLGTSVPGLLSEVLVDRGATVKKGDIVARLEFGVEAAAVDLAKAHAKDESSVRSARVKVEYQRRKEDRASQLRKGENIAVSAAEEAETSARVAESDLEAAEVNLRLAQLELARATELLNQRIIRSPINGVVVERTLGPGEYVFDQAHIMTVSQIDPLNVEVFVPLSQFGKIRTGMSAEVYPEVGGVYAATVSVVDQVFDAASATIGVRLELPNPDYALPAGVKCRVRFPGIG